MLYVAPVSYNIVNQVGMLLPCSHHITWVLYTLAVPLKLVEGYKYMHSIGPHVTYLVGVCAVDEVDKVSQPTSAPPHHRHRHLSCFYVDVYQCHIHSLTRTSLWEHNTTASIQCVP